MRWPASRLRLWLHFLALGDQSEAFPPFHLARGQAMKFYGQDTVDGEAVSGTVGTTASEWRRRDHLLQAASVLQVLQELAQVLQVLVLCCCQCCRQLPRCPLPCPFTPAPLVAALRGRLPPRLVRG